MACVGRSNIHSDVMTVGERALKALSPPSNTTFVRVCTYKDGTCFFHAMFTLLVVSNKVIDDTVVYTLRTSNPDFQKVVVKYRPNIAFDQHAQYAGIALRKKIADSIDHTTFCGFWRKQQLENDVLRGMPSADFIKRTLSDPTQWTDFWAMYYVSDLLQTNIILFNDKTTAWKTFHCGFNGSYPQTALMYWYDNVHFEPVVQMTSSMDKVVSKLQASNSPVMVHMQQTFTSQCGKFNLAKSVAMQHKSQQNEQM